MSDIYNLTDTWDNAGTDYEGLRLDVTDTASGDNSKLLRLRRNGTDYGYLDKNGNFVAAGTFTATGAASFPGGVTGGLAVTGTTSVAALTASGTATFSGTAAFEDGVTFREIAASGGFKQFETRAAFLTWRASNTPVNKAVYFDGSVHYVGETGATSIPDLPGLLPLGDWLVTHFGVIPDAAADQYTAFQAAVTAASGRKLRVPPGDYRLDTRVTGNDTQIIVLDPGVTFSGASGVVQAMREIIEYDDAYIEWRRARFGTATTGAGIQAAWKWDLNSDNINAATSNGLQAAYYGMNVGGDNVQGHRTTLEAVLNIKDATADAGWFYTALSGRTIANANMNGTSGSLNGRAFGRFASVSLMEPATYFVACIGDEIDVECRPGAAPRDKVGLQVVQRHTDVEQGTGLDAAFYITNQINGAAYGPGWKYGLQFGGITGVWAIDATGTLIGTDVTALGGPSYAAAYGVDFSAVTFSGAAFKSTGFEVDGSGNLDAASLAAPTADIGTNDNTSGLVRIFGNATGSTQGGRLRLQTAADHDASVDSFTIDAFEDDLRVYNALGTYMTFRGAEQTIEFELPTRVASALDVGIDDNTSGLVRIFGAGAGSTEGGRLRLQTAADHDASVDSFTIDAFRDDLRVYNALGTYMTFRGAEQTIELALATRIASTLNVGTEDTTAGLVHVFGNATGSTQGGAIRLYTAADHDTSVNSFTVDAFQDDLRVYNALGTYLYLRGAEQIAEFEVPVVLPTHSVATLPTAVGGGMIYVSDEVGGAIPAFSDGAVWRRVTDRAVVS